MTPVTRNYLTNYQPSPKITNNLPALAPGRFAARAHYPRFHLVSPDLTRLRNSPLTVFFGVLGAGACQKTHVLFFEKWRLFRPVDWEILA